MNENIYAPYEFELLLNVLLKSSPASKSVVPKDIIDVELKIMLATPIIDVFKIAKSERFAKTNFAKSDLAVIFFFIIPTKTNTIAL
jgi:hypothetical protein